MCEFGWYRRIYRFLSHLFGTGIFLFFRGGNYDDFDKAMAMAALINQSSVHKPIH